MLVMHVLDIYLKYYCTLFVSFLSMQTEIFAFVAYQILTSFTTWVSVSTGEQFLFVYGGRSALEPVLGDWYFLHTPELSCTAVRMYSIVVFLWGMVYPTLPGAPGDSGHVA